MIRILFQECEFSEIKNSLAKLSDSSNTYSFAQELQQLITARISHFQKLFYFSFPEQIRDSVIEIFMNEMDSKDDCCLEVPIDQILLCFCYGSYKISKERALFSKIIGVYER